MANTALTLLAQEIRRAVVAGNFRITRHAITEGLKDGLLPQDIGTVMQSGEVIEDYRPDRQECLMLGYTEADNLPVHVAVNFEVGSGVRAKTCYIPQRDQWISDRIRKP